jgi:ATP adenylyltransferase
MRCGASSASWVPRAVARAAFGMRTARPAGAKNQCVVLDRLWAGWRSDYVSALPNRDEAGERGERDGENRPTCFLCALVEHDDEREGLILERTRHTVTVMNLYPYGSGHLLIAPRRHVADLEALATEEAHELMAAQMRAVRAIKAAYSPDGLNLGANLGRAAGAGVPAHLHLHALPRWAGDTNFMTAVAEVRVLPEDLGTGWQKLRAAWPAPGGEA